MWPVDKGIIVERAVSIEDEQMVTPTHGVGVEQVEVVEGDVALAAPGKDSISQIREVVERSSGKDHLYTVYEMTNAQV